MASKIDYVVDVRTTKPGENVYGLFKDCGTIKTIHSWKKTGEPDSVGHYFVVFADTASAVRAVGIPTVPGGVSVAALADQPELAAAYMRLHPESMAMDVDMGGRSTTASASSSTLASTTNGASGEMLPPPVPPPRVPANGFGFGAGGIDSLAEPSLFLRDVFHADRTAQDRRNSTSSSTAGPSRSPTNSIDTLPPRPLDLKLGSTTLATPPTGFPTILEVPYMGATLRFDLGSIDPADPRALISLLSKVSAQRASWMMAGAFFRRLGHPSSALEVVSAMVEALTSSGSPEEDLKPAFLFMSGCHTDLSRRTRVDQQAESGADSSIPASPISSTGLDHAAEAKRLLQKAYGTQRPEPPAPRPSSVLTSSRSAASGPDRNGHGNGKRGRSTGVGSDRDRDPGQVQILQREIQSLRDRNDHLTRQLRKAERGMDDVRAELADERDSRRRADAEMDVYKRELGHKQEMLRVAEDALRQVQAHVHAQMQIQEMQEMQMQMQEQHQDQYAGYTNRHAHVHGLPHMPMPGHLLPEAPKFMSHMGMVGTGG